MTILFNSIHKLHPFLEDHDTTIDYSLFQSSNKIRNITIYIASIYNIPSAVLDYFKSKTSLSKRKKKRKLEKIITRVYRVQHIYRRTNNQRYFIKLRGEFLTFLSIYLLNKAGRASECRAQIETKRSGGERGLVDGRG